MKQKPPLGLMPKHIWEECRAWDVMRAVGRYAAISKPVPTEWLEELEYKLRDMRLRREGKTV